jgi:nitrite reductase/ring-hydroxylating ferredoxin subunit
LVQLLRIRAAALLARFGDIGQCKAPPYALQVKPTPVQQSDDQVAAAEERCAHRISSCGPLIASTAAHWLICEAHESVLGSSA